MKRILIIDDDKELAMITQDMLEDYGYEAACVPTAEDAFDILRQKAFELIILDINLPDETGFEVCRELRGVSEVPIIFCSARTSENDRIMGLDIGGDDYLPKPYSLRELLSRVNSLMRRTYGFQRENQEIILGQGSENEIHIQTEARLVTRNGEQINLSLKEFDILCYLSQHMGNAVKKEELLSRIWGAYSEVELSTLTVHVRWLREKLESDPSKPEYIKTVWGVGYRLEA